MGLSNAKFRCAEKVHACVLQMVICITNTSILFKIFFQNTSIRVMMLSLFEDDVIIIDNLFAFILKHFFSKKT